MRVLFGLSSLAVLASVNGQTIVLAGTSSNALATPVQTLGTVGSAFQLSSISATTTTGATGSGTPYITSNGAALGTYYTQQGTFGVNVASNVNIIAFSILTNGNTAQLQQSLIPAAVSSGTYLCDLCAPSCDASNGPASSGQGFPCANLARTYTITGLKTGSGSVSGQTTLRVETFDIGITTNSVAISFIVFRAPPAAVVGDPQIVGMQGQDFQVHGMPDEIFNMVTSHDVQVNARFSYLENAECHDNYTACFAHPGTYISEEGILVGKDKVRITAGSYKKGLTIHVNGKKVTSSTDLKRGSVEVINHRRAIVHTTLMQVTITNSDRFMNQEMQLNDSKLIAMGAERKILKPGQKFHPEVPLHGLQGQTWRNVEYASGLEYEGSIMDYHVVSGNLFGHDFVYNQFVAQ